MNVDIYRESTGVKAFLSASFATMLVWGGMTLWSYMEMRAHQPQAHPADGRVISDPPELAIILGLVALPVVFLIALVIAGCVFGILDFLRRRRLEAGQSVEQGARSKE